MGDIQISGWQGSILLMAVWEIKASSKILVFSVQASLMLNTVSLYKQIFVIIKIVIFYMMFFFPKLLHKKTTQKLSSLWILALAEFYLWE